MTIGLFWNDIQQHVAHKVPINGAQTVLERHSTTCGSKTALSKVLRVFLKRHSTTCGSQTSEFTRHSSYRISYNTNFVQFVKSLIQLYAIYLFSSIFCFLIFCVAAFWQNKVEYIVAPQGSPYQNNEAMGGALT